MKVLVVGTGAGGAMAARQLALSGAEVHMVDAGQPFRPLTRRILYMGALRRTGMLGGERTISMVFPHMQTSRSGNLVTVRGLGAGGCTAISCGNMVPTDKGLKEIGMALDPEFAEIGALVPTSTVPRDRWRPLTRDMFDAATNMGLAPAPTPKAVDLGRCKGCGMCELGCAIGAKWDSRAWVADALREGAEVLYGHEVLRVMAEHGKATGVKVLTSSGEATIRADEVVLAAGGIGTAQILIRSGIEVSDTLWIDPVLTLGGTLPASRQLDEIPMAWYARTENYIISPYLDLLSHFFQPAWRKTGINDRVGMMVKLADEANGKVDADGNITKVLSAEDETNIAKAVQSAESIMAESGVKGPYAWGMINGGHLGGTLPLHREDVAAMHPGMLPENLWIADLSLVPRSQGMPTMMLAAAIGLRVGRKVMEKERQ